MTLRRIVAAGGAYFLIVFAAGFALGAVRVLVVAPRTGERIAELAEMPLMLAVTIAAAAWVSRRYAMPWVARERLAIGLIGLGLLLAMELTVVLWLRGLTLAESVAARDPVSGTAYGAMLALFAVMPFVLARK